MGWGGGRSPGLLVHLLHNVRGKGRRVAQACGGGGEGGRTSGLLVQLLHNVRGKGRRVAEACGGVKDVAP